MLKTDWQTPKDIIQIINFQLFSVKFHAFDNNSIYLSFCIYTSGFCPLNKYRKWLMLFFALFLVYCACLLGSYSVRLPFGLEIGSNPLFFTNIFDIPQLGNEHKYIACKYLFFCKCCRHYLD